MDGEMADTVCQWLIQLRTESGLDIGCSLPMSTVGNDSELSIVIPLAEMD